MADPITIRPWTHAEAQAARPGFIACSMREYQTIPALSRSQLSAYQQTPAHFLHAQRTSATSSAARDVGTAFHTLVLEPNYVGQIRVAEPGCGRHSDRFKRIQAQHEHHNMVVITSEEGASLVAMRQRLLAERGIARLLASPHRELAGVWIDAETGVALKMRIDLLDLELGFILDLKTTDDASRFAFAKSARKYSYTLQAGMYTEGLEVLLGADAAKGFVIVACEKEEPYRVEWYDMVNHVSLGREQLHELLRMHTICMEMKQWPAMARTPDKPAQLNVLPLL